MSEFFSIEIIRDSNGKINFDYMLNSFTASLKNQIEKEEASLDIIISAVEKVWKDRPGLSKIQTEALINYTINNMNIKDNDFDFFQKSIINYIRRETEKFHIAVGKGGGVLYIERLTQEEKEKVKNQRSKIYSKRGRKPKNQKIEVLEKIG